MTKMILLASALAFGSVAYAQDTAPAPTAQPGVTAPDASTPPADAGTAPATPDATAPAAAAPADPAAAPAPDAAGAQPGQATGPNGPVSTTPTAGPTDLPACSKTVTDNCKQGGKGGSGKAHHRRKHK